MLRGIAFGACITLTSVIVRLACGPLESRHIPFQPPPWAFRVVWPCLYATTGAGWVIGKADIALGGVTVFCAAWLIVFACLRQKVVAALMLGLTVVLACVAAAASDGIGGWLLAPLIGWTSFATYLNTYDAYRDASGAR